MNKTKYKRLFVLFDNILINYVEEHGTQNFDNFIDLIRKDLAELHKTYEIMLISRQKIPILKSWLIEKNLYNFFDDISNFHLK